MALPHVGSVTGAAVSRAVEPQQKFGKVLDAQHGPAKLQGQPQTQAQSGVTGEMAPKPVVQGRVQAGQAVARTQAGQVPQAQMAVKAVDQLSAAQQRLDRILALAESGRTFTPAELLGMQARVSQASQQLDLAGKVVDKATSGVKQILQTQV